MKRIIAYLILCSLLIVPMSFDTAEANANIYKEFYVSISNGDDNGSGTESSPFKTIERAQEAVRKCNNDMTGDIVVNVASGRYELNEALQFDVTDSGKNGYRVIYRGDANNMPVISGAKKISDFTEGENGIWQANVSFDAVRGLCVNGVMAERAGTENKIYGTGHYKPVTDDSGKVISAEGIYVNKVDMPLYENPSDVEIVWEIAHRMIMMHVGDIVQDPENENQTIVKFKQQVWEDIFNTEENIFSCPNGPGWDIAFSVKNAYELLDEPGEFYYNKNAQILYYMPRDGEDMNSAEVLCPVIDKIADVKGKGYGSEITNLSFESLTFAHTSWLDLNDYSIAFLQAERPVTTFGYRGTTPGAVDVSWTDSFTVTDCHFYGLETAAIYLRDGVKNSAVKGNTFADIGCGAVVVGDENHSTQTEASAATGDANVFYKKPWTASYETLYTDDRKYLNLSLSGVDEYNSGIVWTNSEELSENPEAKSWIRADLGRKYDISYIRLSFMNKDISYTQDMMSNFEVLVSNDRNFKEYKTLKTYGLLSMGSRYCNIYDNSNEKYRYVMIRKTAAEPFGLTCLWIYSKDENKINGANCGLCINNEISNNCITRVGQVHTAAPAITAYYTEGLVIDHNEITDVPYTGISLGWGWTGDNATAKDNVISNNYIAGYMQQSNDGGGIYVLGLNRNTKIYGNYIKNGTNGYGGIYADGGSRQYTVYDNVMENTSWPLFLAVSSIQNVTAYRNYATSGSALNNGTDCDIEEIISVLPNNLPEEAARIVYEAGITEDYVGISDRIPQKSNSLLKGPYATYSNGRKSHRMYSDFTNSYDSENFLGKYLKNISENGYFGNEPWQYNPKYKFEAAEIISRTDVPYNEKLKTLFLREYGIKIDTSGNGYYDRGDHIDEMYMMRYLVEEAQNSVTHLSIDEMKSVCENLISSAAEGREFGKYQNGAISELRTALNNASAMACETELEKYLVITALENAANTFMSKLYTDEVLYAYINGGKTAVDKDSKTVRITIPDGMSLDNVIPEFMGCGETEISLNGTIALDTPLTLTAVNSDIGASSTAWKLVVTYEDLAVNTACNISVLPEHWSNSNKNTLFKMRNNSLAFQPWVYPYMYNEPISGEIKFRVKADRADLDKGITFILSSKSGTDLEYDGNYYKNTYYMLSLKGQSLELYKVLSGEPTLVKTVHDIGFIYGEYNNISLMAVTENGIDKITAVLGGKTILDGAEAGSIGSGGYFGILTKSVKLEVTDIQSAERTGKLIPHSLLKVYGGNTAVNQKEWKKTADESTELAKNIADGNTSTAFTAKDNTMFVIDLGGRYTISDVRIKLGSAYKENADAYSGTEVYLTNKILQEIGETDISSVTIAEDAEKAEVRKISPLCGEASYGSTLYPPKTYLSDIIKYRYVVIMEKSGYTDIADVDVYTYDESFQAASKVTNVAKEAAKIVKTSYGNKFGIKSYNWIEENATDGDDNTHYLSYSEAMNDTASPERFILDMGAELPVSMIRYISNAGSGRASSFTISAARNGDFSDRNTLLTVAEGENAERANKLLAVNGSYRYILIEGITAGQNISVSEIEVYADSSQFSQGEVFEISSGKPAEFYAAAGGVTALPSDMTVAGNNNIYTSQTGLASSGGGAYILIDLGDEYYLESFGLITGYMDGGAWKDTEETTVSENFRSNLKFFGLSESDMKALNIAENASAYAKYTKYVTEFPKHIISDNVPDVIAGTLSEKSSGLCTFGLTDEAKTKKYRYVGVIKTSAVNEAGEKICDGQLSLKQIRVYALQNNYREAFAQTEIELSSDNKSITVKTGGVASKEAGVYKLVTAFYDKNGGLISSMNDDIELAVPNKGCSFSYNYSIPYGAVKAKAFIFKNLETIEPIQDSAEFMISAS